MLNEKDIFSKNTIWYHGTTTMAADLLKGENFIDVNHNPFRLDFGIGFYLTSNREQAFIWANEKQSMLNKPPMVLKYTIDFDKMFNDEKISFKNFGNTPTQELVDFIRIYRKRPAKSNYSLIYGRVLDGDNNLREMLYDEKTPIRIMFPKKFRTQDQLCVASKDVLCYLKLIGVDKV